MAEFTRPANGPANGPSNGPANGLDRREFLAAAGLAARSGAHAPDEYYVVESANPKVAGITEAVMGYVDMFYQIARVK